MLNLKDASLLMKELGGVMKAYVASVFQPLSERVEALEKVEPVKVLSPEDVAPMLQKMVDAIPVPEAPEPVDVEAVSAETAKQLLASEGLRSICDLVVTEAFANLPPPEKGDDGKSVTLEDVRPLVEEAVKAIPPARDGKDGATADQVREIVEAAVSAIPPAKDGKSVTADEVAAVLIPRLQESFEASVAKHMLDVERRAQGVLERAVAAIPRPKDGRDGLDGLGFENMTPEYDGERTVTLKFQRGEVRKEVSFKLPVVIDRGYWREGTKAEAGDGWTHDGSWWIAKRDTDTKPGYDSPDWRMGARKGRDGQSNAPAPAGHSGPVKL